MDLVVLATFGYYLLLPVTKLLDHDLCNSFNRHFRLELVLLRGFVFILPAGQKGFLNPVYKIRIPKDKTFNGLQVRIFNCLDISAPLTESL